MNDAGANLVYLALMLILPIGALAARRVPLGETAKMALAWIAIFGVLFVLVLLWQAATGVGSVLGDLPR